MVKQTQREPASEAHRGWTSAFPGEEADGVRDACQELRGRQSCPGEATGRQLGRGGQAGQDTGHVRVTGISSFMWGCVMQVQPFVKIYNFFCVSFRARAVKTARQLWENKGSWGSGHEENGGRTGR